MLLLALRFWRSVYRGNSRLAVLVLVLVVASAGGWGYVAASDTAYRRSVAEDAALLASETVQLRDVGARVEALSPLLMGDRGLNCQVTVLNNNSTSMDLTPALNVTYLTGASAIPEQRRVRLNPLTVQPGAVQQTSIPFQLSAPPLWVKVTALEIETDHGGRKAFDEAWGCNYRIDENGNPLPTPVAAPPPPVSQPTSAPALPTRPAATMTPPPTPPMTEAIFSSLVVTFSKARDTGGREDCLITVVNKSAYQLSFIGYATFETRTPSGARDAGNDRFAYESGEIGPGTTASTQMNVNITRPVVYLRIPTVRIVVRPAGPLREFSRTYSTNGVCDVG